MIARMMCWFGFHDRYKIAIDVYRDQYSYQVTGYDYAFRCTRCKWEHRV